MPQSNHCQATKGSAEAEKGLAAAAVEPEQWATSPEEQE
jgi:hypothetical protein